MQVCNEVIPRPSVVREQLARSLREARLLRRLLRLSVEAAQERHQQAAARLGQDGQGLVAS
jgi:hypothetical protein